MVERRQRRLSRSLRTGTHEQLDGAWNGKDRACEDDRHNAGHTNLDGNMGALAAVHLSANHTLCILNRDPALCVVHESDDPDNARNMIRTAGQDVILARLDRDLPCSIE